MSRRSVRLQDLNPPQREAVRQTDGPVLILAGAGTGKTRVITTRIAYMVACGIEAEKILAVTFTNKAANEMRERVGGLVDKRAAKKLTVSTFHSLCVRILRGGIEKLGYKSSFTIYTASDQLGLLRKIIVRKAARDEKLEPSLAQALISRWKNRGIPVSDSESTLVADVAREYQNSLKTLNAVDFDDLLGLAVKLLKDHPSEMKKWRERFEFIMVDEFQDTNKTQMELVRLVGGGHSNVCVVGDDDQSIYGWRGAEIANILEFERFFPDPTIIKLEENYRSTTPILETANRLIRHNSSRREKALWSGKPGGDMVRLVGMPGEQDEAETIALEIWEAERSEGRAWDDFAVLFRTNSQSRLIEAELRKLKVPYRVIGGQSFFERREVKDFLAYLKVVTNPDDDVNLLRIINNPARGISNVTVGAATEHSIQIGRSVFGALTDPNFRSLLSTKARGAVKEFVDLVTFYGDVAGQSQTSLGDLGTRLLKDTNYVQAMKRTCKTEDEAAMREQNLREVLEALYDWQGQGRRSGLVGFLESVALDDSRDEGEDELERQQGVSLITLHASKGLEYPIVYLIGLEEGILPHQRSIDEGTTEEERRLLYVGITRAKERLSLSYCHTRMRYGDPMPARPSSFIKQLDREFVEEIDFDEFVNTTASEETAKGYFGMMKTMLSGIDSPENGR